MPTPPGRRGAAAIGAGFLALALIFVCFPGSAPAGRPATNRPARTQSPSGASWRPGFAAARRYARSRQGEIAFAVIDQRGRYYAFHALQTAPAASVFKVMLLASFLRMRDGRGLSERDRSLLGPMIRRSDSVAATEVRDLVGRGRIERLADRAGMRDFRYNPIWGESRTSPRDQVRFLAHLMSYIPARHRAYARYLLSHVIGPQRWGIGRVVPPGWKLFLKGGWGSGIGRVDHQVAILRRGDHRVVLALFTQFDPSHAYGKRALRGLAARLLRGLGAAFELRPRAEDSRRSGSGRSIGSASSPYGDRSDPPVVAAPLVPDHRGGQPTRPGHKMDGSETRRSSASASDAQEEDLDFVARRRSDQPSTS